MAHCVALHAHHEASLPIEFLDESYASRLETINTTKAREEEPWQIKLRKKLFCEILPADMPTWLADLLKQSDDLWKQSAEKLIAFHDSICHCGWTRTNNNIFNFPR